MKTKLILMLLITSLATSTAYGQMGVSRLKQQQEQQQKQQKKTDDSTDKRGGGRTATRRDTLSRVNPDRVLLYRNVQKRYGRWEGYGKPLTREEASHLRWYYRLTYVAGSKYPARMEALDGYHQLTTDHSIGTYLANQGDDKDTGADSLWQAKLATVCQWAFVYNEKDDIAIERAYDSEGNLVYAYYPVKIGQRWAGTFTDAWGMPAKLRKDGGAQVVYISYDENGWESLHEFYDEQGRRQPNMDGAFMTRIKHRKDGLITQKASCNILGQPMIDVFGNCGMQVEEYDKNGNEVYDINMNEHWQPIRVTQGNDPFYYNMVKRHYEYDGYGRVTRMSFVDLENRPDTNSVGIHAQELTYNTRGRLTSMAYRDLQGNLKVNPYNGLSRWKNTFDEKTGRVLSVDNEGDAQKLDSAGNYQHIEWTYDKNGEEIASLYRAFDGNTVVHEYYTSHADGLHRLTDKDVRPKDYVERRIFSKSGMIVTIAHDEQGRQTLWAYEDMDGNPIAPYGYCQDVTEYTDESDSFTIETEYYLDATRKLTVPSEGGGWSKQCIVSHLRDGKKWRNDIIWYGTNGQPYSAWCNLYNSDGQKTGEIATNRFGTPSRIGGYAVYHTSRIEYDITGEHLTAIIGQNEWGEPAYIEEGAEVYHYARNTGNHRTLLDEHGDSIPDMEAFKAALPAVMTVVVTDSAAYRLGIHDGDVILKYGDWASNLKAQNDSVLATFYFELIDKASMEKELLVLRHHPEERRSEVISLRLPAGTIQQLGIFPQLLYYTEQEKERYETTLHDYLAQQGMTTLSGHSEPQGNINVLLRVPRRTDGYVPTLDAEAPDYVFNPAAVLSMAKYEVRNSSVIADEYWNMDMGLDTLWTLLRENRDGTIYLSTSTDLKSTADGFSFYKNSHQWMMAQVTEEQYARVSAVFADFMQRRSDSFNPEFRQSKQKKAKKQELHEMVIIRVEGDGKMRENGFEGTFTLARFNSWRLGESYEKLGQEIEVSRQTAHHMVFIPIDEKSGKTTGKTIKQTFQPGILGTRFLDTRLPLDTYKRTMKEAKRK